MEYAARMGLWARSRLTGARGERPPPPPVSRPQNNFYVVLRDRSGHDYDPALVCHSWFNAQLVVLEDNSDRIAEGVVFMGWPTEEEARAFTVNAGRTWPGHPS